MTLLSNPVARPLLWGAASGAVGTTVLNAITYGDMLLRGRPASGTPAKAAGILADDIGISSLRTDNDDPRAEHRREAAGALLGYATGVGIGMVAAVALNRSNGRHLIRNGVLLGVAAMAASDGPIVLTGASDPRTWSPADWLSDVVPHVAYGLATAASLGNRGSN
jgi:hypothetical protein